MKSIMTLAILAAMAAASTAQDSNRNRMNDQVPDVKIVEREGRPSEQAGLPSSYGNRMNIEYGTVSATEMTGDRNPNENRMNTPLPKAKAKAQPKKLEPVPFDPAPKS